MIGKQWLRGGTTERQGGDAMYSRRYFLAALFTALGFVLLAAALGGFLGWPLLLLFMVGMGFLLASVLVTPPVRGQDKRGAP